MLILSLSPWLREEKEQQRQGSETGPIFSVRMSSPKGVAARRGKRVSDIISRRGEESDNG